jgi:predicted Fe-Mo cluster-binding NifX family protein
MTKYVAAVTKMKIAVTGNTPNLNAEVNPRFGRVAYILIKDVEAAITGYCGPKAFATLKAANITIASDVTDTVKDAVVAFNKEKL